jgi:hypothetical protein
MAAGIFLLIPIIWSIFFAHFQTQKPQSFNRGAWSSDSSKRGAASSEAVSAPKLSWESKNASSNQLIDAGNFAVQHLWFWNNIH